MIFCYQLNKEANLLIISLAAIHSQPAMVY
ncbi:hypothetical protein Q426_01490 [Streptococcus equi subsp. zooepidemicus CY]|nr:hypothetical protein Q426_01490 [Streptococcus equi subsp. zooepidemicus CY]